MHNRFIVPDFHPINHDFCIGKIGTRQSPYLPYSKGNVICPRAIRTNRKNNRAPINFLLETISPSY
jgi:hypothetical protein